MRGGNEAIRVAGVRADCAMLGAMTDPSSPPVRGSCVCGAVRYTVRPPFIAFQCCHCSRCRKASGGAFTPNLFVPTAQLSWDAGERQVRRFDLPDAKYWSHCFCDTCGSAVPWLARSGKVYVVPAGTLDDHPGITPLRNIHFASRAPWHVDAASLETFDEGPPR